MVKHPLSSRFEVFNAKEQSHSTGKLLTNHGALVLAVGSGEEKAGLGTRRFDHDPPFWASVVRCHRIVLNKFEAQGVDEESDGDVVVLYNERKVFNVHGPTVSARATTPTYERRAHRETGQFLWRTSLRPVHFAEPLGSASSAPLWP